MPDDESRVQSLHDRTLRGLGQLLERALDHVHGVEKVVVNKAAQVLYPRVAQRIRGASETDLRKELVFLHELLGGILNDSPVKKNSKTKRRVRPKPRPKRRMG